MKDTPEVVESLELPSVTPTPPLPSTTEPSSQEVVQSLLNSVVDAVVIGVLPSRAYMVYSA